MKSNIRIFIKDFRIKNWLEKVVEKLERLEKLKPEQISIVIVGDRRIQTLNQKYRRKNEVTDVLSFAQTDIDEKYKLIKDYYLGEIFINFRQAERQAENIKDEILSLLVHGYLHLKGYTHDNDKGMTEIKKLTEKIVLKIIK